MLSSEENPNLMTSLTPLVTLYQEICINDQESSTDPERYFIVPGEKVGPDVLGPKSNKLCHLKIFRGTIGVFAEMKSVSSVDSKSVSCHLRELFDFGPLTIML